MEQETVWMLSPMVRELLGELTQVDATTKGRFAAEASGFRAETEMLLEEVEGLERAADTCPPWGTLGRIEHLAERIHRWRDRITEMSEPDMPGVPSCPFCRAELSALTEQCPSCRGDLGPLLRVTVLADVYFNTAVAAARQSRWPLAAEQLAVTLALRPDDVDAWVLCGKIRFARGQRAGAVGAWREALSLAPERDDIRATLTIVDASPS
jgi:tetratricopeptide (TPR) repeat protein